jgi:hypothetical protein
MTPNQPVSPAPKKRAKATPGAETRAIRSLRSIRQAQEAIATAERKAKESKAAALDKLRAAVGSVQKDELGFVLPILKVEKLDELLPGKK